MDIEEVAAEPQPPKEETIEEGDVKVKEEASVKPGNGEKNNAPKTSW